MGLCLVAGKDYHRGRDLITKIAPTWMNVSLKMKEDPETDKAFGWVPEMYASAIASALRRVQHILLKDFMLQPSVQNAFRPLPPRLRIVPKRIGLVPVSHSWKHNQTRARESILESLHSRG